jgi:hypothetical protein
MRIPLTLRKLTALLMVTWALQFAHASADPNDDALNDPAVQRAIRAMANASTWFHPDLFGEFAGMRDYAHRQYASALKNFEGGAYYADKFSQLTIGLMYLNGEGTKKDPVTAYAWIDLASERGYPDFVATRDRLRGELTAEQFAKAMQLRSSLGERYGDVVAKPRLVGQLRLGMMQMTGSHTGFGSEMNHLNAKGTCGPLVIAGGADVSEAGCGGDGIYARERWDPDLYFASRDRQFKATVTVGPLDPHGAASGATTNQPSLSPLDPSAEKSVKQN